MLQNSNNAAYRALASQGLTLCGPQEDSDAPVVAESARPATPWLDQLRDPDQVLQDIRSAWNGADFSQQRSSSDQPAASPWSLEKPTAAFTTGDTARFAPMADEPTAHEATVAEPVADVQTTDEPAPTEQSRAEREPEAPEAGLARVDDSAVFSSDEWTDYARGLLLVELSSGTGAMR